MPYGRRLSMEYLTDYESGALMGELKEIAKALTVMPAIFRSKTQSDPDRFTVYCLILYYKESEIEVINTLEGVFKAAS